MASDGEIIAMRAAGVPSRKVIAPVLLFAALGMALAAFASLRLTPLFRARDQRDHHEAAGGHAALRARSSRASSTRTFPTRSSTWATCGTGAGGLAHRFPRRCDAARSSAPAGMREKAEGPLITVAREAIAVSDPKNNRIQLSLRDYSTHEMGKDRWPTTPWRPPASRPWMPRRPSRIRCAPRP